jgi:hypothetical protein
LCFAAQFTLKLPPARVLPQLASLPGNRLITASTHPFEDVSEPFRMPMSFQNTTEDEKRALDYQLPAPFLEVNSKK